MCLVDYMAKISLVAWKLELKVGNQGFFDKNVIKNVRGVLFCKKVKTFFAEIWVDFQSYFSCTYMLQPKIQVWCEFGQNRFNDLDKDKHFLNTTFLG